ncbi:MAG: N-terminal domain of oligopeptide transport permease, partial [Candidatus Eremiobacteraeota bacterium]|nr:N-terminal domain of oligopeptide transport permease [Candidatus Eremiobacteraeota bacterium]
MERARVVVSTSPTELAAVAADPELPSRSFASGVWRRFRSSGGALVGALVVATIVLLALFAPVVAPHDPLAQDLATG